MTALSADSHGYWEFLELWRSVGHYDDTDIAFLASIAETLTHVLRTLQSKTFALTAPPATADRHAILQFESDLEAILTKSGVHSRDALSALAAGT